MQNLPTRILQEIMDEMFDQRVMSNLARPHYVERMITHALGEDWKYFGADWAGWDIENNITKARIEVKQSACRQSWSKGAKTGTKRVFDIKERTGYYLDGTTWIEQAGRPADLYIFAWHDRFDPEEEVDHRDPNQWDFYCFPEGKLPSPQKSITLRRLVDLGAIRTDFSELRPTVELQLKTLQSFKNEQHASQGASLS